MKTISYHTEKEIRIGLMIALFVMAVFATIKVRELQSGRTNYAESISDRRIELSLNNFPAIPVADARLVEEPMMASEPIAAVGAPANEHELALELKTMVIKGEYWSNENAENNEELALQMSTWLKNGTYYSPDEPGELPPLNTAIQTNPAKYVGIDSNSPEKDVASQMKIWIAKGDYWSAANN